jgi:hypothetical protein
VRAVAHDRRMETEIQIIDVEALLREIQRYLAAVDAFRAEGYPPRPR